MHGGCIPCGLCIGSLIGNGDRGGTSIGGCDSSFIGVYDPPSAWCCGSSSTSSKLSLPLKHISLSKIVVEVLGKLNINSSVGYGYVCLMDCHFGVQGIDTDMVSCGQESNGSGGSDTSRCRGQDGINMLILGSSEYFGGRGV